MEILILCVRIFFTRIIDVSMGTFRTIMTVRGKKYVASFIGFVEVFIWFLVVKDALSTGETNLFVALSYAGGYACGTIIGGLVSERFVTSNLTVQVITSALTLPDTLREKGYAVTVLEAKGMDTDTEKIMLILEISNKKIGLLKNFVKEVDDKAFVIVNETKYVLNGYIGK